jgi:hypothetical protein
MFSQKAREPREKAERRETGMNQSKAITTPVVKVGSISREAIWDQQTIRKLNLLIFKKNNLIKSLARENSKVKIRHQRLNQKDLCLTNFQNNQYSQIWLQQE